MLDSFIRFPLRGQRVGKIGVGLGIIRVELERPLVMWNGFILLSLSGQRVGQITMVAGRIRLELERPFQL